MRLICPGFVWQLPEQVRRACIFVKSLHMEYIQAFLLGLLQGITEFLPVSSSGHLALGSALLGTELAPGITFEIVVHFGSFCSIVVYFHKRIGILLSDLFNSFSPRGLRTRRYVMDASTRLVGIIFLSMIPAGVAYVLFKDPVEAIFRNPTLVSFFLLITGAMLFSTRFVKEPKKSITAGRGFMMGVAQAFALIPGISRSGSTISTGLFMGVNRDGVANFSFLMVLPVLGGAMLYDLVRMAGAGLDMTTVITLVIGFFTSFISGYFALKYLIILLKREKIHYFAFYCWAVGVFGLIYF